MTVIAPAGPLSSPAAHKSARPSYAHVHWYMLAAFAVVMLGFWPTFYQPLTSGTTLRNVHGVTSTLWYLALVVQPWLVTNGYVRWHRGVAVAVIALLPIVTVTALMNTRVMLTRGALPPIARPLIAYLDVTLVALFVALFLLGLRNRKTPAAHKRYMVSTSLIGFPPAITRFVARQFGLNPFLAINISLVVVELLLITLIVVDWRMGERRRWAYPIALATHVTVQLFMTSIPASAPWLAFCRWFAV
ncbi:MAG TPA: hypothetical protein VFW03_11755 [Gemmatimonadaceae bacterium]|nr:hypothetical protein [Gemmatimonadaceae bacterium]